VRPKAVFLAIPVLIAVAFLVYSNSLESPFVSDDIQYIKRSPIVQNFSFPEGLTSLRPITKASYRINSIVHSFRLPGYHLVNIALHALAGVLLFLLFQRMLHYLALQSTAAARPGSWNFLAFCGALLFLVHPIHTQAVNYTFARSELLCAVFLFAALLVHANKEAHRYGYGRAVCVSVLFLLALGSKERAFMFVPALIVFDLILRREESKAERYRRWYKLAVPLGVAVVLGLLNLLSGFKTQHAGGFGAGFEVLDPLPFTLTETIVRLFYLKLYAWPEDLAFYHHFIIREDWLDPVLWAALGGHIALAGLVVFFWRREGRVSFGILWYFLLILPSAGLVPAALLMHEQWIYISSFGVILVILIAVQSWLVSTWYRGWAPIWKKGTALAFLALCFFLGSLAHRRNEVWQDTTTLWHDACSKSPEMQWVWNNLGTAYIEKKRYAEALAALDRVEKLGPPSAASHLNIGLCQMHLGDLEKALERLQAARDLYPNRPEILFALAQLYRRMGRHPLAVQHYLIAGRMGLPSHELYLEMAEQALATDQKVKAVEFLSKGAKVFPKNTEIREMLDRLLNEDL